MGRARQEPLPLRLKEYPREGVLRERDFGYVTVMGTNVNSVPLLETQLQKLDYNSAVSCVTRYELRGTPFEDAI